MTKFGVYHGKDEAFRRKYANGGDVGDDYDYAAAEAAGVKPDERGHMPDTYKKPNHMTFSKESQYSGKDGNEGGSWDKLPPGDSNWMFTAGKTNMQQHTPQDMQDYFNKVEPDSLLKTPDARVVGD